MRLLTDLFKNKEVRKRIFVTLALLLVFRLGTVITVPNIDSAKLATQFQSNSFIDMMNILGGGSIQSFSIFSLGVGPYITASIIIQLLAMDVIPALTELTKSGQQGQQQLDRITRYLAVVLAYVQGITLLMMFNTQYKMLIGTQLSDYVYMGTIMAAGSLFLCWLGDQITQKGIGNGISILIFAGIVSSLPTTFIAAYNGIMKSAGSFGYVAFAGYVVAYLLIVVLVIFMSNAVRKISIQYTSNVSGSKGSMNHLPLMINSASVMPVIFTGAIMNAPQIVLSYVNPNLAIYKWMVTYLTPAHPVGLAIYAVLIVLFTFFYTNLQIDPEKIAEDFGKNGSYIPGVRPGKDTERFISTILNRITVYGAAFLLFIAILPFLLPMVTNGAIPANTAPGGTGIIIVVGVALETVKELEGRVATRSYRGLFNR